MPVYTSACVCRLINQQEINFSLSYSRTSSSPLCAFLYAALWKDTWLFCIHTYT